MKLFYSSFLLILTLIIATNLVSAAWTSSLNTGIVSYWTFNETGNILVDTVTGAHNGTLLEGVEPVKAFSGRINNSWNFTNSGYSITNTNGMMNSSISINSWFNVSSNFNSGPSNHLFRWNGGTPESGMNININDTVHGYFYGCGANNINTGVMVNDSRWHMVTFTQSDKDRLIYVDGVLKTNSSCVAPTAKNLGIGSDGGNGEFFQGKIDEMAFWNRTLTQSDITSLYNSGSGITYNPTPPNSSVAVTLLTPVDNSFLYTKTGVNFTTLFNIDGITNITRATLFIKFANGTLYDTLTNITNLNTNTTFTFNSTRIPVQNYTWYVQGNFTNTTSSFVLFPTVSNFTFSYVDWVENSQTFNSNSFFGANENFILNTNYDNNYFTSSSAILTYNNTNYTGIKTQNGNNVIYNYNFNVPSNNNQQVNNSFFWTLALTNSSGTNYYKSTMNNQSVSNFTFGICSPTNSVPYINFTFKDEASSSSLNASLVSSSWNYFSGSVNSTFIFTNLTLNPSYAFCFSPSSVTFPVTLNSFQFSSTGYPQRTYSFGVTNLTNSTTNTILYLLGSSSGIYSSILVVQGIGSTGISGANVIVEEQINSNWATIASSSTDGSGIATFWLNPNTNYRYTVNANGYISQQFTLSPSQSIYTVRLQPSGFGATAYNSSLTGYKWYVTPQSGVLLPGINVFNLTLFAPGDLFGCQWSIINASNLATLNSTSGGTSTYCNLSISYNLANGENIFGQLAINNSKTNGLYMVIDTDWKWKLIDTAQNSTLSITAFFQDLSALSDFGGDSNRAEFSRIMFFFLIMTILLAVFCYTTGFELQNPGIAIVIIWFIIGIASYSGFLTYTAGNNANISPMITKYGLFIIYSMFTVGYIGSQIRRNS